MKKYLNILFLIFWLILPFQCRKTNWASIDLYQAVRAQDIIKTRKLVKTTNVNAIIDSSKLETSNVMLKSMKAPVLSEAVYLGNYEIVQILLESGADPDRTDKDGITPLMIASRDNRVDLQKLLLSFGAHLEKKDNQGYTALMCAGFEGHKKAMDFLLEKGADINAADISGNTVLMWSIKYKNTEIIKWLLNKNPRMDIINKNNKDSLKLAEETGNKDIFLIIKSRITINEKNNSKN